MDALKKLLRIEYPIIMAPMFLVSNTEMVISGMKNGIAGCIPALNYRTNTELETALITLKDSKIEGGAYGFNLIVNQSNIKYKQQLETICKIGCDFIITSLGNPKEVIKKAHQYGILVFCDVTNLKFAQKVEHLGADAIIAVNNLAGGHRGNLSPVDFISILKRHCKLPIISAGGVSTKSELDQMLSYGASGVSVGSPFIASQESKVSDQYKNACITYSEEDIVITEKISGTPCTVINTPYVQKIGTQISRLERYFIKHKVFKKWIKLMRFILGTNAVTNAAKQATYKTVWVAGPSIKDTKTIEPVKQIIHRLVE